MRSAMCGPDSRVSRPINTRARASGERPCELTYSPSASPTRSSVASSKGTSPGTPRIPSVPKSCLVIKLIFPAKKIKHAILSLRCAPGPTAAASSGESVSTFTPVRQASVRAGTPLFARRWLCYRTAMPLEEEKIVSASTASGKIIAAGIVIAFCYWASSILVTLLVAVLLAYFLDPVVNWLEDWHVPRALGSLLVVLFTIAAILVVAWNMVERVDQFGRDWPLYRKPLHQVATVIEQKMATFEEHVSEIEPGTTPGEHIVSVGESHPVRAALLSRLSSLYEVVVAATFVPFLLFFMLAAKRQVWHATMQLFPATRRTEVKETLADVTMVLRSYVVGTALVGLILVVFSWLFFWGMGLDFPFLLGLLSGMLNLIPYLGVVLSWVPPILIGIKQFHTP